MGFSILSLLSWASRPPTRRGTTSSGHALSMLAASADGTRSQRTQTPDVAANSLLRSDCDWRRAFASLALFFVTWL